MRHNEQAKALYLVYKGKVRELSAKLWEQIIAQDFAEFRKASLTSAITADVKKELDISRVDGEAPVTPAERPPL